MLRRFHHFTELKKNFGNQTCLAQSISYNTITVQLISKSIRDLQSYRSMNIRNIARVSFKQQSFKVGMTWNLYCLVWKSFRSQKDYRFLISFLVPELLRFKNLKNYRKNGAKNARSWIKSIRIDKICDVMWWTSDSKQSLIILCIGKYLSKSFETLKAETARYYAKDL